jgi:hypothetical protein
VSLLKLVPECVNTIPKLKELTLETIFKLPKELTPEISPCVMVQGYHEDLDIRFVYPPLRYHFLSLFYVVPVFDIMTY